MKKLVVSKFGGTSMGTTEAMLKSARVCLDQDSTVIVVSATSGTTNQLLEIIDSSVSGNQSKSAELNGAIRGRHLAMAQELKVNENTYNQIENLLDELSTLSEGIYLLRECSPRAKDRIQSIGERLSSAIFVKAMQTVDPQRAVELFDVRNIMITDDNFTKASVQLDKLKSQALEKWPRLREEPTRYVTQGFIGRTEDGETTTLGRGGSDYSASLIAEAVGADICEIWTDVSGIASTDPRLCPKARPITEITFQEAAEMAVFGAKVLHPTTLTPARRAQIPVFVGNTFSPQEGGTWVRNQTDNRPLVRALALKKGQALLTLSTPKMLNAYGFLYSIFKIFNDHKVSVDAITTSEISVSMTVDEATTTNRALFRDLEDLGEVKVEKDFHLVSLIGNKINTTAGLGMDIFSVLKDINVRMICQGASIHNFCFLTNKDQGEEAIKRLHRHFLE